MAPTLHLHIDSGAGIRLAPGIRTATMDDVQTPLEKHVDKLWNPFRAFIGAQTTASGLLAFALLAALVTANSPFAESFKHLQHFELGVVFGDERVSWSVLHLVNDGLISLFFFLIGLEVKRELLAGELNDSDRVKLLASAAIGGMVVPASLYATINATLSGGVPQGWGIPMATDTTIAIGVLAALGSRVPKSVIAFLVGVAILDDIGAILVIALVYTETLHLGALLVAASLLLALVLLNVLGIRHPLGYTLLGILIWAAIVQSGVHASIAGVVVAAAVPARPQVKAATLRRRIRDIARRMSPRTSPHEVLAQAETHQQIVEVERVARAATTPLRRWEDGLELPVALIVLPMFAFLNAGIVIDHSAFAKLMADPVAIGILVGLVLGKPVGIVGGVLLSEALGWAKRPDDMSSHRLIGIGLLSGVGFTMSTFIAHLALDQSGDELSVAKLAIVSASLVAAVAGYMVLHRSSTRSTSE